MDSFYRRWGVVAALSPFVFIHLAIPSLGGTSIFEIPRELLVLTGQATAIGLALLLAAWRRSIVCQHLLWPMLAVFVLYLPGLWQAAPGLTAWEPVLGLLLIPLFWWALLQLAPSDRLLLTVVVAAGALAALLGLLEFFGLSMFWDDWAHQAYYERISGAMANPNTFASFLVIVVAAGGALLVVKDQFTRLQRAGLALALVLISLVVVIAASRLAWIALLVVYLGVSRALLSARDGPLWRYWTLSVSAGVAMALFLLTWVTTGPWEGGTDRSDPQTIVWRLQVYEQTLRLIGEHIWWGVGFGNWIPAYTASAASAFHAGIGAHPPDPGFNNAHNIYLQWWSEAGVFGFAGIAIFLFYLPVQVFRQFRPATVALATMFTPTLLHVMVEYPLRLSAAHGLMFAISAYLLGLQLARPVSVRIGVGTRRLMVAMAGLMLVLAPIFLLNNLRNAYILKQAAMRPGSAQLYLDRIVWAGSLNDRFEWMQARMDLRRALAAGDRKGMEAYAAWTEQALRRAPDPGLFEDLIFAYDQLGNAPARRSAIDRYAYTYPDYAHGAREP